MSARMITAVIRGGRGVEALAATLASLVSGVAEGLIADAIVVVDAEDEETLRVTNAVGAVCLVLPPGGDPWRLGVDIARREWLLCLEAGDLPRDGWISVLERFLGGPRPAPFARLGRAPLRLGERWVRGRDRVLGASRPRAGDLVHRTLLGGAWPSGLRPRPLGAVLERLPD